MEECVFRAVPLALGALIGERYGRRKLGIAIAFVLQAVVFGGAHANYPGFPSYSRLVELTVPSMLWALIFLRYGLLPTIMFHALFDLALISIPLFLVDAEGAWVQRALVIAAALVPAGVVLMRRLQNGAWGTLPAALRNGAWRPLVPATAAPERATVAGTVSARAALLQRALPLLGLAGLAAWIAFTALRADVPPLAVDRGAAEAAAVSALAERRVVLGPQWHRFSAPRTAIEDPGQRQYHAFVWREAGAAAYRALVGRTLAPPLWDVRFVRFDGDVADRAEEWRVTVAGDGRVRQVLHRLPEAKPGAQLERDAAQAIAERALHDRLGQDAGSAAVAFGGPDAAARAARLGLYLRGPAHRCRQRRRGARAGRGRRRRSRARRAFGVRAGSVAAHGGRTRGTAATRQDQQYRRDRAGGDRRVDLCRHRLEQRQERPSRLPLGHRNFAVDACRQRQQLARGGDAAQDRRAGHESARHPHSRRARRWTAVRAALRPARRRRRVLREDADAGAPRRPYSGVAAGRWPPRSRRPGSPRRSRRSSRR